MVGAADFKSVLDDFNATSGQILPLVDLAMGANKALTLAHITDPVTTAVWLATLTQESAMFRTTEEYDKTGTYAPYIGRSFQQITWKSNYQAFGQWCVTQGLIATPSLFVDKPKLLAETQWAWLGGVWFFGAKVLWDDARRGDFQSVQVAVNGASPFPRGWLARLQAYQAWTRAVVKPPQLAITGTMDAPTSRRLQQWVGVAIDGDVGKITYTALQAWLGRTADGTVSAGDVEALQEEIGAYVDGDWGPGTTKDLQAYLNGQA